MTAEVEHRDIPGYVGVYYITSLGEVFRQGKTKPVAVTNMNGTPVVRLHKKSKAKNVSLTTLMSKCFFNNKCYRFKHKNGDLTDFAYKNLEPCNPYIPRGNGKRKSVVKIKDGKPTFYATVSQCAAENHYCVATISNYCCKKLNPTDNAIYMFEDEYYRKHSEEYDYHPTR